MQKGLMELVFPVGSIYVTQTETNPAEILEFGTWERFNGKNDLGLDPTDSNMDTIGKQGGRKEAKLSRENLGYNAPGSLANGDYWGQHDHEENRMTPFNIMNPYEITGYKWIRRK